MQTVEAIASKGAQVVQADLVYDEVVWAAASSTAGHPEDLLIQDTAWRGYEQIRDGLWRATTLFDEIDMQLGDRAIHLVAVPTGVGSCCRPHCLTTATQPLSNGRPSLPLSRSPLPASPPVSRRASGSVSTPRRQPSWPGSTAAPSPTIAWPAIRDGLDAGVAVTDDQARAAMHRLHELGVPAGPCGGAAWPAFGKR